MDPVGSRDPDAGALIERCRHDDAATLLQDATRHARVAARRTRIRYRAGRIRIGISVRQHGSREFPFLACSLRASMTRERWMALFFAVGSACFVIGPLSGYARLVGDSADAVTFFVGSVLFTIGGALQSLTAWPERHGPGMGPAAWRAAAIQSAGTLFFNVTTFQALHTYPSNSHYDRLVWRPDAFGSICFLVSGVIAYQASPRRGWLPLRGGSGWWEPSINLLGCIFFGISAVAGYIVPQTGSMIDLAAANWNTSLGAVCFLVCALATLFTGRTLKSPRLRRLHALEHAVDQDVDEFVARI
jgi:hypothetical protein